MSATTMPVEIVSREEELDSVRAFLEQRPEGGPAALVLEGEAGIGKSTLWLAGVEMARERGLRVLSARPAEAERLLAHVGLGDLLEDVLEHVLPKLPPPRRRALEVALLVQETGDQTADPRTLAVAVRSSLQLVAEERPLLLAVDDLQWLDPSSAGALAFALRRLDEQSIQLLLARRVGDGADTSVLEQAIETDRAQRMRVGVLSVGAIQRMLQTRLGRTLARPTLLRVHDVSGGNPFFALELVRALGREVDPTRALPVPETLSGLIGTRLAGLPEETRDALALTSALGNASTALLVRARVTQDALDPAFAAHVIERADGEIRFTHPLLATVLYQGLSTAERLRTHRLLAEIVDDPIHRTRHLALSTDRPNPEVAAALEEAATLASSRGAPIAGSELAEHALRLTPLDAHEHLQRRAIAAARAHYATGEARRARALAHDLLSRTPPGPQRAEALILVSDIESSVSAIQYRRDALSQPGVPAAQRALIHQWLAYAVRMTEGIGAAVRHAQTSLEIAEQLDEDALRAWALSALAVVRFRAGDAGALDLAEQAYELASTADDPRLRLETTMWLASSLVHCFVLERARDLLEDLLEEWTDHDETVVAGVLWHLGRVNLGAGRLAAAAACATRTREINLQYGEEEHAGSLGLIARIAAHRGDLEDARGAAARGRQLADELPVYRGFCEAVLALVDLWSGDAHSATTHFAAAEEALDTVEFKEPVLRWWRADYAQALLALGWAGQAVELVDSWEADAAHLGREWVLAEATRSRALLAAARGELHEAQALLELAVGLHEAVGDPFNRARSLLALGVVRRRARKKRSAREAIEAALAGFETIGAAGWRETARAELARVGGRAPSRGTLTPSEQRVAALVAEGRTNREVAAALFVTERTVEAALTRVYGKLGVRSRTELAGRLLQKS